MRSADLWIPWRATPETDHGRPTQELPCLGRPAQLPRPDRALRGTARERLGLLPDRSDPPARLDALPRVLRPGTPRPTPLRRDHDGHPAGLRLFRGRLLQPQG